LGGKKLERAEFITWDPKMYSKTRGLWVQMTFFGLADLKA
jgi:hypothetical protein